MVARLADVSVRPAPSALTDEEIVTRVIAGEPELFELLMRRHNRRIYRAVRAVLKSDDDCEDVMQQAYVSAFAHLRQFRGAARFTTWLTRIAVNQAIQHRRRVEGRPESRLSDGHASPANTDVAPSPEHAAYAAELGHILESALDTLSAPYRIVFALREIEGMSTAETAAALDINEDTVKTRLHRAKAHLRERIARQLGSAADEVYAFHLSRCDRVVENVMRQLGISTNTY